MFNALIRTHHITSRKKVAALKAAAKKLECYALLRSGSSPGMMYVEGDEESVRAWVDTVHHLRYKDYQLVSPPAAIAREVSSNATKLVVKHTPQAGFEEVEAVKDFGKKMEEKGLWNWWRQKAGYSSTN